jgi:hypothetical protein
MNSMSLEYRLGHDIYRISVTVMADATLGRKMFRPEVVIEKNVSDMDAEDIQRLKVSELFSSEEKAQRFALGYAKKVIESTGTVN